MLAPPSHLHQSYMKHILCESAPDISALHLKVPRKRRGNRVVCEQRVAVDHMTNSTSRPHPQQPLTPTKSNQPVVVGQTLKHYLQLLKWPKASELV